MDRFGEIDEELGFFDALEEDISSASNSDSDCIETPDSRNGFNGCVSSSFHYDMWIRSPQSTRERRSRFLDWMELSLDRTVKDRKGDVNGDEVLREEIDRVVKHSGEFLSSLGPGDESYSGQSSVSSCSTDGSELLVDVDVQGNLNTRMGILDDDLRKSSNYGEMDLGSSSASREFVDGFGSSNSACRPVAQEKETKSKLKRKIKGLKEGWLHKLRLSRCAEDGQVETGNFRTVGPIQGARAQRVRVRQSGKRFKELSALYKCQDIEAHKGSILTMKFSPDGQYLASAGEDGIVRVWQVMEDEGLSKLDILETDPSCLYFRANHSSELSPLPVDKEKMGKLGSFKKSSDSACVILPPKVFRILEKPLHEFHGHSGEILDLSWSKNNLLLSASVDMTVRLWKIGCDPYVKVFQHNNYVTCVQFNPVDDGYFISSSIDGKVRIWGVLGCQVVDWTDVREIVTSVCYRPDGRGAVVGSIAGNCRFYNLSDNHLQLDDQISLRSKKKSSGKRITGLQFLPEDSSRLMVTCADSQVRILQGNDVISKYKGFHNAGCQIVASVTSDGKRIVSACDDSNVYVWNCRSQEETVLRRKSVRSCERFSANASVAIPWCGFKIGDPDNLQQLPASETSSVHFSLSEEFLFEPSVPKGSATWPEEILPKLNPLVRKSQYKFLRDSCQSTSTAHSWGLVIVTAGWDGRIRSFHNYGLPVPT